MKFLVCQRQSGVGCDYTIGCGMSFDWIEADTIDEVQEQIIWPDGRDEHCTLTDARGGKKLCVILIIPAEYVFTVDVPTIAAQYEKEDRRFKEEQEKQMELAELKRLQKKYR